jgi:hypothetical protein
MDLRVPDSGSLLGSLLSGLGRSLEEGGGDLALPGVTAPQLDEAIAAMVRGDIEYLILEERASFLQAAGEGDGPYALQVDPGDGVLLEVPGGVSAAEMRASLRAYRDGDPGWRHAYRWASIGSA